MSDKTQTKALFRCVLAYSDGRLVRAFDLEADLACHDRCVKAIAHEGTTLTVAVARSAGDPYCGTPKPESFAAAYEMFINEGDLFDDNIEWVRLNQT